MDDEILTTIRASHPRRFFGLAVLVFLGGFLVYMAFGLPSADLRWQVLLLVFGGAGAVAGRQDVAGNGHGDRAYPGRAAQ